MGEENTLDEFWMYEYKVRECTRMDPHDWALCPFVHPGDVEKRRDPRRGPFTGSPCLDFNKMGRCQRGDECKHAHGELESRFHPLHYRTRLCKAGFACRRSVCSFAHTPEQLRRSSSAAKASSSSSSSSSTLPISPFNRYRPYPLWNPSGSDSNAFPPSRARPSLIRDLPGSGSNAFLSSLPRSRQIQDPSHLDLKSSLSSVPSSRPISRPPGVDLNASTSSRAMSTQIQGPLGLDSNAFNLYLTAPSQSTSPPPGLDSDSFHLSLAEASKMATMEYFPVGSSSHDCSPTRHSEGFLRPYDRKVESGMGIRVQILKNLLETNNRIREGVAAESGNDLVKEDGEKLDLHHR